MNYFTCLFLGLGLALGAHAETLVSHNSPWKFRKGTNEVSAPMEAWRLPGFNDTTWASATAPFSYGEGNTGTVLSDMRGLYLSVYLRQTFVVTNLATLSNLHLEAIYDDGFAAWINGTLVASTNIPANLAYTSGAAGDGPEPAALVDFLLPNPPSYLVVGTNILAIQAFNKNLANSGDFIIGMSLTGSNRVVDTTAPVIAGISPAVGSTVSNLASVTVTFSEPVTGLGGTDLLLNGVPSTRVIANGNSYTFSVQPLAGPVQVSWDPGVRIQDLANPPNAFNHAASSWNYTLVDRTPPMLIHRVPAAGGTVRLLSEVELHFSEPVTGLNGADLLVNGRPATNLVLLGETGARFGFAPLTNGTVQISWAASHGITDLASPANAFAGDSWEITVDANYVLAPVRINEVLAANSAGTGLRDEDGDLQDWIELYNDGNNPVNLEGWSLTDDDQDPGRWTFPNLVLGPRQFLVVFASGKDRKSTQAGAGLHTSFKLNPEGESLALFNNEFPRLPATVFRPKFPEQRNDHSYGLDPALAWRYYSLPTPGQSNGVSPIAGLVPAVHFNIERGFFSAPFSLILNSALEGAQIRFTTDGSEPTQTSGQVDSGPLRLTNTTVVRAAAFMPGYLPSRVVTQTYLFPSQVVQQTSIPPGLPGTWAGYPADYGMDPEIVTNALYRDKMEAALLALPTLSIAIAPEELFDATRGIYTHSLERGPAWERACSAEWINADGSRGFQANCGVQIQGNANRDPQKQPKHALRLVFKGDYGATRLNFPVFPDSAVTTFDSLVLRADYNNSWLHFDAAQRARGQRTRDAFMKDSMRAMVGLASHNRFVHLYLNGIYWGVYDPTERPDAAFAADYLGGEKEDYDVINEGAAVDGTMTAYNAMLALPNLASNTQFDTLQTYLNLTQFIDYTLLHFFVGHQDWGLNKNWYTFRRKDGAGGFYFLPWDGENTLQGNNDNRVSSSDTASGLHGKLVANVEYRLAFADRVQKHLFNGGALTPAPLTTRWMKRAGEIDLAIIAESARWGDYRRDVHSYSAGPYELYTRDNQWLKEQNRLITQYFPARTGIVLSQLRTAGLFPNTAAPILNQNGGRVPRGFTLTLSAGAGSLYYTTNGLDPRVPGTSTVATSSRLYQGGLLLQASTQVKARVLNGTEWSALTEALFQVDQPDLPLRFSEILYNPAGGDTYEFVELENFGATPISLAHFYTEGFTYVFPPETVLGPGQRLVLASSLNPAAFAARYPGVTVAGYFSGNLSNGGERLALKMPTAQTVFSVEYRDDNGWPAAADGSGASLESLDPLGDPDDPANWKASTTAGGSPGLPTPASSLSGVVFNEVMAENTSAVANNGTYPDWIELFNRSSTNINLAGWSLSDDGNPRKCVFPSPTLLGPGAYLMVWCDAATNTAGLHCGFALKRSGQSLFLFNATTNRMDAITYGLQLTNYSISRFGSEWTLSQPTPSQSNTRAPLAASSNLFLNEWLANAAPGGEDWIELWNRDTQNPAALQGLLLGTRSNLFRITSLSFVPPGGYVQLLADQKVGPDHLDFKLPAEGDQIRLLDQAGAELQRVDYGEQQEGVSEGFWPQGTVSRTTFVVPSPSAANLPRAIQPTLRLNEVLARNRGVVRDPNGAVADWIELFNSGSNTVLLTGCSLSFDLPSPGLWRFPAGLSLPAQGYLVVWCNGALPATSNNGAFLNTGQALAGEGGAVYLFNASRQLLDSVTYGAQVPDQSIGWNGNTWSLLASPTPGSLNREPASMAAPSSLRINEWLALPGGLQAEDFVELFNPQPLPVALEGLYLSNDPSLAGQTNTRLPALSYLAPRGFVSFPADGQAENPAHLGFNLDGQGGMIGLLDTNRAPIDAIYYGSQQSGISQGLLPDGATAVVSFAATSSPGAPNFLPIPSLMIHEILTRPIPPQEQAVELFNPGQEEIDLSGWYLSDSLETLRKYRLPAGTRLRAHGYKVIYENDFNGPTAAIPFRWLGTSPGWVVLAAADAAGDLTGYRVQVQVGPVPAGVSLGRYSAVAGDDFIALTAPTFGVDQPTSPAHFRSGQGAANLPPRVGPLVFAEIFYEPAPVGATNNGVAEEFIELQVISKEPLALFDPAHPTRTWRLSGGVEFTFPTNLVLTPDSLLLLVPFDPVRESGVLAAFKARWQVPDDVLILGPYAGKLANEGDRVQLLRPESPSQPPSPDTDLVPYLLVEEIHYQPQFPWPQGAAGLGDSLHRLAAEDYGNNPNNWTAAPPTPGRLDGGVPSFLLGIQWDGTQVVLSFVRAPARSYRLLYRDEAGQGTWQVWQSFAAQSGSGSVKVTVTNGLPAQNRFYRVVTP